MLVTENLLSIFNIILKYLKKNIKTKRRNGKTSRKIRILLIELINDKIINNKLKKNKKIN